MISITYPGATAAINPYDAAGYEANRAPGTVVHQIAGRAGADATLAPAGLRTGTLWLVFSTAADAKAAEEAHALPKAFTLTDSETPELDMYYIVFGGEITRRFEAALVDGQAWMVGVPFQEVTP